MTVLLLDFDHTLYPSTLPTLAEVDRRITLYLESHLGLSFAAADQMRKTLCGRHGTTLRGLMLDKAIDPHHYCDFVHDVGDDSLPPPDPALRAWLLRLKAPTYVFTNARADWTERCMKAMGLWDLVGENGPLLGVLDLPFTGWMGKPDDAAYAAVERFVAHRHGPEATLHLVDDRLVNLAPAVARGWRTHWVKPHTHHGTEGADGYDPVRFPDEKTTVLNVLTDLHPVLLCVN